MPVGVSLKPQHFRTIIETNPNLGFFEIHAENYMVDGGPFHHYLAEIRSRYPLSIHGTALSIGGAELDLDHLKRLVMLVDRYEPAWVSEHLAWSTHNGSYLADLLPIRYSHESLSSVCQHIQQTQSMLRRTLLLENPATYIRFANPNLTMSDFSEADFISEVVKRTGCHLLLDVNNVFVTCHNHELDVSDYLNALPLNRVAQIHLAGFEEQSGATAPLLIDSHGAAIADPVWDLFESIVTRLPESTLLPILIERDNNVPPLADLILEAQRAQAIELKVGANRRSGSQQSSQTDSNPIAHPLSKPTSKPTSTTADHHD